MKVYLDTVGCRLNQSEIESMARQFRAAGHEIVAGPGDADMAVVNTCAVTAAAASDSRATIRRIARAGAGKIVATGCWVSLEQESAAGLPQVWRVVTNDDKDHLVGEALNLPQMVFDVEPSAREPLPGLRRRTRAFIKVQDGCNNHCTFCITTVARGRGRSRAAEDIVSDARSALDGGAQEIVLTGVHLGSWGQELGLHLKLLVQKILRETPVPRLRLSSLEPWDLDADFFSLWEEPRLCRHLHLPLQSGCPATLRRMARKTTPKSFRQLVQAARQVMPEAAITTDMIAGFPGETRAEFEESLDFAREMKFAGGHAFSYSARPGTAAARLGDQLSSHVRQERRARYRELFDAQASTYSEKFVGQTASVLWESPAYVGEGAWRLEGWTDNYVRVVATAQSARWNEIDAVDLVGSGTRGLVGVIRKSG